MEDKPLMKKEREKDNRRNAQHIVTEQKGSPRVAGSARSTVGRYGDHHIIRVK